MPGTSEKSDIMFGMHDVCRKQFLTVMEYLPDSESLSLSESVSDSDNSSSLRSS